jgi:hypothetical protein
MPPSPEQVAALLSKYKAIIERQAGEKNALRKALREIAYYDDFLDDAAAKCMLGIARGALSVTRPDGGRG